MDIRCVPALLACRALILLFGFLACAFSGTAPPPIIDGKSPRKIVLNTEQVSNLRPFGTIAASETQPDIIRLPQCYFRQRFSGRIDLLNDFGSPIEIQGVKTSCGCVAAVATVNAVGPGETTSIPTSINPTKPGEYSVTLTVLTNQGAIPIRMSGDVLMRVDIRQDQSRWVDQERNFRVPIQVIDKDLDLASITVSVNGRSAAVCVTETGDAELSIQQIADQHQQVCYATVVRGDEELLSKTFTLVAPGDVRLVSKRIIARNDQFNLLFSGDIESIDLEAAVISQDHQRWPLQTKTFGQGSTLVVQCLLPSGIDRRSSVVITLGDKTFPLEIVSP